MQEYVCIPSSELECTDQFIFILTLFLIISRHFHSNKKSSFVFCVHFPPDDCLLSVTSFISRPLVKHGDQIYGQVTNLLTSSKCNLNTNLQSQQLEERGVQHMQVMSALALSLVWLGPNGIKLWLFQIRFRYIWYEKVPCLSHLRQIWPNLCTTLTPLVCGSITGSYVADETNRDVRFRLKFSQVGTKRDKTHPRAKINRKLIWKNSTFVPFYANLSPLWCQIWHPWWLRG